MIVANLLIFNSILSMSLFLSLSHSILLSLSLSHSILLSIFISLHPTLYLYFTPSVSLSLTTFPSLFLSLRSPLTLSHSPHIEQLIIYHLLSLLSLSFLLHPFLEITDIMHRTQKYSLQIFCNPKIFS